MENIPATYIWAFIGAIFIALEAFGMPGIGFIFAGISAIITSILININIIGINNYILQMACWLGVTTLVAITLWKPMKKWRINHDSETYNNIIGGNAVASGEIKHGKIGAAMWSGAIMKAKLAENSTELFDGDEAKITATEGNILILKKG